MLPHVIDESNLVTLLVKILFIYHLKMSSSSSSESEDENIALLRQAVDTNFISDDLFAAGELILVQSNTKRI